MRFAFHPEASVEMDEAIDYYNSVDRSLGTDFQNRLADALDDIDRSPNAWQIIENNCRRRRLVRFPFGVVYKESSDRVVVYAIMHLKRRPGYWTDRL